MPEDVLLLELVLLVMDRCNEVYPFIVALRPPFQRVLVAALLSRLQ